MSTSALLRFSVCAVFCFTLIQFGVMDTPQLQAQETPEGPPAEGGDEPAGRRSSRGRSSQRNDRFNRTQTSAKPKFEKLLENKDLSQFRGYKTEEIGDGWMIEGKTLHLNGSGGDLITSEEYDNFELRFEFKVSEGANSGVMYRVSLGDDASYVSGPEYQILDDANHADGEKEETSVGSLYALYAPTDKKMRDAGVWNTAKIIVDGDHVVHYLNGKRVVDVTIGSDDWNERIADSKFKDWEKFGKNESGHIAFQDHGNEVWFRGIMVKRLVSAEDAKAQARSSKMSKMKQMQLGVGSGAAGPPPEDGKGGGRDRKKRTQTRTSSSKLKKMQQSQGSGPGGAPGGGE